MIGKETLISKTLSVVGILVFAFTAGVAFSDDATTTAEHQAHHAAISKMKEPSPEMRQKMAEAHQKMADCLKSAKPFSECKQEMMKSCPMMKDGHMDHVKGGMMSGHEQSETGTTGSGDHSAHH